MWRPNEDKVDGKRHLLLKYVKIYRAIVECYLILATAYVKYTYLKRNWMEWSIEYTGWDLLITLVLSQISISPEYFSEVFRAFDSKFLTAMEAF